MFNMMPQNIIFMIYANYLDIVKMLEQYLQKIVSHKQFFHTYLRCFQQPSHKKISQAETKMVN